MGRLKTVQASTGTSAGTVTGIDGTATAKSADYTVLDTDRIRTVLMTTGAADKTVTLPTAADNTNRIISIKKVDSGAGNCIVDGEGSETIDALTTRTLYGQNSAITLMCNGTSWSVLSERDGGWVEFAAAMTASGGGSVSAGTGGNAQTSSKWRKRGNSIEVIFQFCWGSSSTAYGTSGSYRITLPNSWSVDSTQLPTVSAANDMHIGQGYFWDVSAGDYYPLSVTWSGSLVRLIVSNSLTASGVGTTAPVTIADGDMISVCFTVPITAFSMAA